jgi:hypothetical protein
MTGTERTDEAGEPSLRDSRTDGEQDFSILRGEFELKAETAAHKRQLERMRVEHELEQERKSNEDRRQRDKIIFFVVVFVVVAGLAVGFAVAVRSQNDDTRRGAQNIVTILFSAMAGGLAGYFTGKAGK